MGEKKAKKKAKKLRVKVWYQMDQTVNVDEHFCSDWNTSHSRGSARVLWMRGGKTRVAVYAQPWKMEISNGNR